MRPDPFIFFKRIINNFLGIDIRLLKKGYGYESERYSYQSAHVNFEIRQGEKVLDIGSGPGPFPLATHLADRYPGETTHRFQPLKLDSRPFIICDIESMPFKSKEFDFIYCSHLLEHTENPGLACMELMRVGKRGYIETPSKTSDTMLNFSKHRNMHKWHSQILGDTIIFLEWKDSEKRDLATNYFFDQFHSVWKNPFQDMVYKNRDLFVNMFLWEDKFDCIVINKDGRIVYSTV